MSAPYIDHNRGKTVGVMVGGRLVVADISHDGLRFIRSEEALRVVGPSLGPTLGQKAAPKA